MLSRLWILRNAAAFRHGSIVLLAGVFLWAGAAKILQQGSFFNAIAHFRILSPIWAYRLALYLPWIEVGVALAILLPLPRLRDLGLAVFSILLAIFTAGIISLWAQGERVACGCFGGTNSIHPAWLVARNLSLMAIAMARFGSKGQKSLKLGETYPGTQ